NQPESPSGHLLQQLGADIATLREKFAKETPAKFETFLREHRFAATSSQAFSEKIEIHGLSWKADYVRDAAKRCLQYDWIWLKAKWKPRDAVIEESTGRFSFDLALAKKSKRFRLVKGAWKKDHCTICRWELFESKDDHGAGYTNGYEWLCEECFERFVKDPGFFSPSHTEIT